MVGQEGSVCPDLEELVPSFADHLYFLSSAGLKESESEHGLFSVLTLLEEVGEGTGVKGHTQSRFLRDRCLRGRRLGGIWGS